MKQMPFRLGRLQLLCVARSREHRSRFRKALSGVQGTPFSHSIRFMNRPSEASAALEKGGVDAVFVFISKNDLPSVEPLKQYLPYLPVILVHAAGKRSAPKAGARAVFTDYLAEADVAPETLAGILAHAARLRRARAERRALEDAVRELSLAKSELVSVVSHELRTPLAIMQEGVLLLGEGVPGPLNERQQTVLQKILSGCRRLETLIDDLLSASRLGAGGSTLKRERVDTARIAGQLATRYQAFAASRGIALSCEIPASLPPVFAERERVEEALDHLLENAFKFTPEGGRVRLLARSARKEIIFSVSDSGPGIPEKELPKLFRQFEQIGRTEGGGARGTGMGLYLCQKIIGMHGGRIWVESKPGKGCEFRFTLPVYISDEVMAARRITEALSSAAQKAAPDAVFSIICLKTESGKDGLVEALMKTFSGKVSRAGDEVFRAGAARIGVMLPNTGPEGAGKVAEKLKQSAVAAQMALKGPRAQLRWTLVSYPKDGRTAERLMDKMENTLLK